MCRGGETAWESWKEEEKEEEEEEGKQELGCVDRIGSHRITVP